MSNITTPRKQFFAHLQMSSFGRIVERGLFCKFVHMVEMFLGLVVVEQVQLILTGDIKKGCLSVLVFFVDWHTFLEQQVYALWLAYMEPK